MNLFEQKLLEHGHEGLHAQSIHTVQLNLGLRCNLSCAHCHLQANPSRTEQMSLETMELVLEKTAALTGAHFDITGGSPELNPHLKPLIQRLTGRGNTVQVRTNMVVMLSPEHHSMPAFYRDHRVGLVASLPCYLEENVRKQRGNGVYEGSVRMLRELNRLGYGVKKELPLSLVFNPGSPALPPPQVHLESAYRKELGERFGIKFTRLLTITNMPIGRFREELAAQGKADDYDELLTQSFNPATVEGLMCRHQISIDWDGYLSDCDFNRALNLRTGHAAPQHISDFDAEALAARRIVTGDHCFGCTAGSGSSCGGALVDESEDASAAAV